MVIVDAGIGEEDAACHLSALHIPEDERLVYRYGGYQPVVGTDGNVGYHGLMGLQGMDDSARRKVVNECPAVVQGDGAPLSVGCNPHVLYTLRQMDDGIFAGCCHAQCRFCLCHIGAVGLRKVLGQCLQCQQPGGERIALLVHGDGFLGEEEALHLLQVVALSEDTLLFFLLGAQVALPQFVNPQPQHGGHQFHGSIVAAQFVHVGTELFLVFRYP